MALSPTIFPVFTYRDAPAALDWLAKAFGFAQHVVYPNEDGSRSEERRVGKECW